MFALALVGIAIGGAPARWPDDAFPISYWVGADLGAAEVDDAKGMAAIARAFETWQAVDCFDAQFLFEGRIDDAAFGDPADGRNTVFFVGKDWPGDSLSPSATRVVADANVIREGDIGLNAEGFQFAVDGDGHVALDIESALTHEIGRLLGLDESEANGATMNPQMVGRPEGRSLETADLEAICALYGPSMDTGIPMRTEQGDPCTRSEDCTDGFVCVVDNGDQYCAARCGTDGECGSGTSCKDPGSGSPVCILVRATGCGVAPGTSVGALAIAFLALALRRNR
jgi:hypothetical protein